MLAISGLADPDNHTGGIGVAPFATTHAPFRREVERIVSNLEAHLSGRGSFSDELGNRGRAGSNLWNSLV